jgi:hypothetical protein
LMGYIMFPPKSRIGSFVVMKVPSNVCMISNGPLLIVDAKELVEDKLTGNFIISIGKKVEFCSFKLAIEESVLGHILCICARA